MPAKGGPATQVTHKGGFFASESPDGQYLYYAKGPDAPGVMARAAQWRQRREGPRLSSAGVLGILGR